MNTGVATLLAALLGGALSIAGGFVAGLYTTASADRLRRRQEVRNILEKVYERAEAIHAAYVKIHYLQQDVVNPEDYTTIADSLAHIALLVEFYMPPLEQSLALYRRVVTDLMLGSVPPPDDFESTTRRMQSAIVQLYRRKGYTYFQQPSSSAVNEPRPPLPIARPDPERGDTSPEP